MKPFFLFVFFAFLGAVSFAPSLAFGQAPYNNKLYTGQGEVINEDYGAAGEVVEIVETVRGDVYVVGGQVFISGIVEGDVLALGGVVHISGTVTQNVRVAGGQVVVSGEIGRNATIAAMNVVFTDSARVKGGVVVAGANVLLASPVAREARIAGRNVTLANVIGGDLEVAAENIRVNENANLGGDFTYWSNQEAFIHEGAEFAGRVRRKSPQELTGKIEEITSPFWGWVKPFVGVSNFFTTLILGFLLIRLFPVYTDATVHVLKTRKLRSLMSGITALLLVPLLFGLLIITIVGVPLGIFLLVISSLLLYVARIFVMLLIGRLVVARLWKKGGEGTAFLFGLILYSFLMFIPTIGWILSFSAVIFGLGAALESLKEMYAKAKAKKEIHS